MNAFYVSGGACLGAGIMGATSLNPAWGWAIVLGAALIVLGVIVEVSYYK